MARSVFIKEFGGAEKMFLGEQDLAMPGPGQVLIRQHTCGINFMDIELRKGLYKKELPLIIGSEACGMIEEVGPDLPGLKKGDRVAYATSGSGGYSEARIIDSNYIVVVPDYISDEQASLCLLKGMTAHYLMRRTFYVTKNHTVLIYSAAGGVGQFMCQLAKHYGAKVIGAVGSNDKIQLVKSLGVDAAFNYNDESFVDEVKSFTKNQGVDVIYDFVGAATFEKTLKLAGNFSLTVLCGFASGTVPPIDITRLSAVSGFLTAPHLFFYKQDRNELILSANEIFAMIEKKILKPNLYKRYKLDKIEEIRQAHSSIENRMQTGQSLILV